MPKTTRAYYLRWIRAIRKKLDWICDYLTRMYERAEARKKTRITSLITYMGVHLIAFKDKLKLLEFIVRKGGNREE